MTSRPKAAAEAEAADPPIGTQLVSQIQAQSWFSSETSPAV
jgi:hypothetical protein